MSDKYTPTTDAVQLAAETTTLEGSCLPDGAFGRWLASVERAAAERAWQEGAEAAFYNPEIRGYVDYPDENPYRAEAYRREGKE